MKRPSFDYVAADLLAQAEHGSGHERVWLVTTSAKLVKDVERELARTAVPVPARLCTARPGPERLAHPGEVAADAVALTNRLAPEHCEVMTRNPRKVSNGILTAGAILPRFLFAHGGWAITWPGRATRCRRAARGFPSAA